MNYYDPPDPREHDLDCPMSCSAVGDKVLEETEYVCPVCGHDLPHECMCAEIGEDRAEQEAAARWEMNVFIGWDLQQP